jgi:hypothetical protein
MGLVKELYVEAHERAIEMYLEEHPDATEEQAYDATADTTYEMMGDRMADMADMARMRAKEGK